MHTTHIRPSLATLAAAALLGGGTAALAVESLDMDLGGHIDPRCEFVEPPSATLDFSVEDSGSIGFELYCNLAMTITVKSRNGAVLHERLSGRLGRAPEYERVYDAQLSLDAGGFVWDTDSIAMQNGVSFSTGDAVVFDTSGRLDITLRQPIAGVKSHAGDYNDTISITLSPSLAAIS